MPSFRVPVAILVCGLLFGNAKAYGRELTFEERVRVQKAIERVYYSHQVGARRPFDQAVPHALLERRVRTYLKQTVAVEEFWRTRISGAMLRRELERMAAGTRMPERLLQLYAALGNDALLIQECLARPALVDRLSRNFFASDASIHAGSRRTAESLRGDLVGGRIDPWAERAGRNVTDLVRVDPDAGIRALDSQHDSRVRENESRREVDPDEFEQYRSRLPDRAGEIGPVIDDGDAFVIHVVLEMTSARTRFATFAVPKLDWDAWWRRVEGSLDVESVVVADEAGSLAPPPIPHGTEGLTGSTCAPDDTWDNGSLDDWPEARHGHMAVWTGSEMIVWGGGSTVGGRYDPATDTWRSMSATGAPPTRSGSSAVWTGSELIVWGATGYTIPVGGRYDPAADTWRGMSTLNAPPFRLDHTAVWTGSEMIVWGGDHTGVGLDTGGRYHPATDTWEPTATAGAPAPRFFHDAVWTGSQMIVWGGVVGGAYAGDGGRYDPTTDTWLPVSTTDAPTPRGHFSTIWTGSRMIVWGGYGNSGLADTGGQYDPATDTWTPTSTINAPTPRYSHTAVWTGTLMLVWGSSNPLTLSTGGRYDPVLDAWTPISTTNAPSPRSSHSAIWTGSMMIVWGGAYPTYLSSGGRYDPLLDAWTPTADTNAPAARYEHSTIWTGSHVIVWGGYQPDHKTGARYDPATDTWRPTSTTDAPVARHGHTAVWTGDRMIVWGGTSSTTALNSGGRYDPISDAWTPTSNVNAPSARDGHGAAWTGRFMVVWGGLSAGWVATGGRYDPEEDVWTPTSTANAPQARFGHTTIWTGSRMIVWGGSTYDRSGGRYDPDLDAWTPTSSVGAPQGRLRHTAVWSGSRMIVWGGSNSTSTFLDDGGRYDPSTDLWTATSRTGAPSIRSSHIAVWTGRHMVVWGGIESSPFSDFLKTGGRYDPAADTWAATAVAGAPAGRIDHTAVWTGSHVFLWGGYDGASLRTGGLYAWGHSIDDDGDGFNECQGDCNDGNGAVHPGALEICDGIDNDCDGLSDNATIPFETPDLVIQPAGEASLISWSPVSTATHYDLVRGDLSILVGTQGDFSASTQACVADNLQETFLTSSQAPVTGGAFWYLVRAVNCGGNGTYDSVDPAQAGPRDGEINASASSCP